MTTREQYTPAPAFGAEVQKHAEGGKWGLVLVRELHHSPEKVWQALTDPAQLSQWAPFDAAASMATAGAKVSLTTVGAPKEHIFETTITRAEAPRTLEYDWAGNPMRWQLEPAGAGTRLTLWINIDQRYVAMGAAGWHICFDVLDSYLSGAPIGRMVGMETMKFPGFQRLHAEYANQFGVELPNWGAQKA